MSVTSYRHETPVLAKPLKLVHVDEDIVVLDKPCSLPVSGTTKLNYALLTLILTQHGYRSRDKQQSCLHRCQYESNLTTSSLETLLQFTICKGIFNVPRRFTVLAYERQQTDLSNCFQFKLLILKVWKLDFKLRRKYSLRFRDRRNSLVALRLQLLSISFSKTSTFPDPYKLVLVSIVVRQNHRTVTTARW